MREREKKREREREDRQTKNGGERVGVRRGQNMPSHFLTDALISVL